MNDRTGRELKGRVALVTGASSGIGRAVAAALSRCDASVCLTGRNEDRLRQAASSCQGPDITIRPADLADFSAAAGLSNFIAERYGHLDILVHCAGLIMLGETRNAALDDLGAQFAANVTGPYALTQALLPGHIERRGDIVFLNSSITRFPRAGAGQYAMTKFALTGFADSLRGEVNGLGVRVLSVYPGRTATPVQEGIYRSEGRDYDPALLLQPADVASTIVHALTLPRTAEITDIHIRPMIKG